MNVLTSDNLQLSNPKTEGNGRSELQLTAISNTQITVVNDYINAATSNATRRAYLADLDHFLKWGGSIPCLPERIAAYLAAHADSLKAATLKRRVVALGLAHTAQGHANPCNSDMVRMTMRGISRIQGSAQVQAAPAVREDVLAMVCGLKGMKGIRDNALLLLGFAGAFRRSELVSLNTTDLEFVDRGVIVHLRRSKTDQGGVGRKIAIPFARGAVCPVVAIQSWLTASEIIEGPIFRPITKHERIIDARLSGHAVAEIVKARAAAVGLKYEHYSGHSLRSGLITSAATLGVSVWKIKAQSGHRTDAMVSRYVRDADLFTNNAAGAVL